LIYARPSASESGGHYLANGALGEINRAKILSNRLEQSKLTEQIEIAAEYSPDTERMLQALAIVLDLDLAPVADDETTMIISDLPS
jgi:hypothetical protein